MRIKLADGKQKELFLLTKEKKKLSWKKLAEFIKYNECYVRNELLNEKTLLSEEAYKKLRALVGKNFDKFILKKLDNNWGKSKGGKLAKRTNKKAIALVEQPSAELAEIIGIILGDGNIWAKKGFYYVRITGHLKDDRKYLLEFVKPLIFKVLKCGMQVQEYKKNNRLVLSKASKDLVFTLSKFGLPAGSKKVNNVSIPKWVFESDEYLRSCIRGLIDTDGSVCPITGRNYSFIWFRSAVPALRESFSEAMKVLNIKTAK